MLKVSKVTEQAKIPFYATENAAGLDLSANQELVIAPKEIARVRTGIKVEIPKGHEGQVRGRSGLAFRHNIFVTHIGTIDADYRGEIYVLLENKSQDDFIVKSGDRIGQLVVSPVARLQIKEVSEHEFSSTERGEKGFGSTGFSKSFDVESKQGHLSK